MSCQLSDKRATLGTCVNVKQCSAYVIGLLKVGLNPTVCKLKNDPNAVCCPTVKRISEQSKKAKGIQITKSVGPIQYI